MNGFISRVRSKLRSKSKLILSVICCLAFSLPAFAADSVSSSSLTIANVFTAATSVWTGISSLISNWITWIASNTFVLIPIGLFLIGAAVAFVVRLWRAF